MTMIVMSEIPMERHVTYAYPISFRPRVRIAVVGPDDLVEHSIMAQDRRPPEFDWQLIAAGYREEHQVPEILRRLAGKTDACLFTGPLPYDIARRAEVLHVPATFVPLNDAALYRALLEGGMKDARDLARVSIDTLSQEEIEEAAAEIEVPVNWVRSHPYEAGERSSDVADFHLECWRAGEITTAMTCVRSVWQLLRAAGVPTLRVVPTQASVRAALRTVGLMGMGSHLADAQIAVAMVEFTAPRIPGAQRSGLYWREELRLPLHQLLLSEARRLDAVVQPLEERGFLLVTTVGALAAGTEGFRSAPFVDRIRRELGIDTRVGVGIGRGVAEAAEQADRALVRARECGARGFALSDGESFLVLPGRDGDPASARPPSKQREDALRLLRRLVRALPPVRANGDDLYVVVAEEVAGALHTTPRTARRNLQLLNDEGLVWPLPSDRTPQPGRPRRRYRLMVERLSELTDA
jgi:hypothetical protein